MWGLLLKSQTSTLERFQVSLAFRSRSGILTSTPLAWTWEWKWDPRHLEQHENNFPCQDSRITWKTCLHTILSNWNMNGWLIEKCVHTVNPHFQDDLVIADQLVCWLGTFVFCILCLILSILTDLFDCFDDECELFCWDVFVMTPSFWLQKLYQHHTMYSRWKWSMKIKCPCLLHRDQLSLLEDSKSPHIAHIRGLLVKLHSQLSRV